LTFSCSELLIPQQGTQYRNLLCFFPLVITVMSLENITSPKPLVMSQQNEGDEASANAVSFPASVLKGGSFTGKIRYDLIFQLCCLVKLSILQI